MTVLCLAALYGFIIMPNKNKCKKGSIDFASLLEPMQKAFDSITIANHKGR